MMTDTNAKIEALRKALGEHDRCGNEGICFWSQERPLGGDDHPISTCLALDVLGYDTLTALLRDHDALRWRDAETEPPPIDETIVMERPFFYRIHGTEVRSVEYDIGYVNEDTGQICSMDGDVLGDHADEISRWRPFVEPEDEARILGREE